MTAASTMAGSKGATVGRKRQPQSKAIARTVAGKFGAKLAALADARGMSAVELAERLGKSPQIVRLYYAGKVVPHINEWPTLVRVLRLNSMCDLLP